MPRTAQTGEKVGLVSRVRSPVYIRGPLHHALLRRSSVVTSKVAPSSLLAGRAHRRSRCDEGLPTQDTSGESLNRLSSSPWEMPGEGDAP